MTDASVIRNPGEMYCWNDHGHRVCDDDFGTKTNPVMFLVSSRNYRGLLVFF